MDRRDDLDAAAGRTLMVGLPGPELDRATVERLREIGPAGVILFARNVVSVEGLVALRGALLGELPAPTLVAIDQEGGRVSRLRGLVGETPTAACLARDGVDAARGFGRATGAALAALGCNVDFAPVVDLCAPGAPNGIGDRSFGTEPGRVVALAGAFLDGLQARGVAGCLKHFPGLGATAVDSHRELPTAARTRDELLRDELEPFRGLAPRAAAVMVGHGHYPALDPEPGRPASLSPAIVRGLLRGELGFSGLVVSDDLEMGAVAALDAGGRAAVGAVAAGCDLLLYCSDLDRALAARRALVRAAGRDEAFAARLLRAAATVARTARSWPAGGADPLAWDRARRELAGYA